MIRFLFRRVVTALCVAVTVSLLTFVLLRMSTDPAIALAGEGASAADIERVRVEYGLDRPLLVLYGEWASRALHGDLGRSHALSTSVSKLLQERLPVTFKLGGLALIFALALALPLGVAAGTYPNSLADRVAMAISVLGQSMPTFWFGLILILYFGVYWRLLPISGDTTWAHYILPASALGFYSAPSVMRLTRAGMVEALSSDYIRTARAKGLLERTTILKHAFGNAMVPVVSLSAVQLGLMLGGSIVIETVFSLNGIGRLAWESIKRSDFDVMQAIVLVVALIYIGLMLAADLLNAYLDPRIRMS